jgi:hypothetical protein
METQKTPVGTPLAGVPGDRKGRPDGRPRREDQEI